MTQQTPPGEPAVMRWTKTCPASVRRFAAPALTLMLCVFLLWLFQHLSRAINYHLVVRSMRGLPPGIWILALLATVLSYVALVARDAIGLRYIDASVPRLALWMGATIGSALGNATGFGALTGGAVRCRIYGAYGVKPGQVGRLTVFTGITLALSLFLLTSLGMAGAPPALSHVMRMPPAALAGCGWTGLVIIGALIASCRQMPRRFRLGWFEFDVPGRAVLLAQLGFAANRRHSSWRNAMATAAAWLRGLCALHHDLRRGHAFGHDRPHPGWPWVFEASMVFALGGSIPTPAMVAALLAYRVIYFGVPVLLSAVLLAGFESRAIATRFAIRSPRRIAQLAPVFLSMITFVVGGLQVISSATPAFGHRLALLRAVLPLWVIESSQLLASVAGVLLLFVARGLMRRLDGAWWLAIGLAASQSRAVADQGAGVRRGRRADDSNRLAGHDARALLPALVAVRRTLHGALARVGWRSTARRGLDILLCVSRSPYTGALWHEFAFEDGASRSLRATLGAALFAAAFALWQLLRPAAGHFATPARDDLREAARIIRAQERSDAGLAMMGDKSFLFSASAKHS